MELYARNNIFKRIKMRKGHGILKTLQTLENLKKKYVKIKADIEFIKHCKGENIIPTFAKVNRSLEHSNCKIKSGIKKIVIEAKLQINIMKRNS